MLTPLMASGLLNIAIFFSTKIIAFTFGAMTAKFIISVLSATAFLCSTNGNTQPASPQNYPQGYFRNPLGIPIQLVANFGALRTNHYHMGLDIRTQQRENLPIYAAAEGFISRIKIERFGFGRAIYITHPNGFTTLYAHLNNFYPALNAYLKTSQYAAKSWEQDLYFSPGQFKVTKGQFIAYSGNTGGSAGPHLHFEIRETYSEENVNPLLFGFEITDNIAPVINQLYLYDRSASSYETRPRLVPIRKTGANYAATSNVVTIPSAKLDIGINALDKVNGSPFAVGVFSVALYLDGKLQNGFSIDDFSYPQSRYINGSTDYSNRARGGSWIQYIHPLPANNISIFTVSNSKSYVELTDTDVHKILLVLKDAAGNSTSVNFNIQYNGQPAKVKAYTNATVIVPNQPNVVKTTNLEAYFSDKAFYDTVYFTTAEKLPAAKNAVSPLFSLHNYTVPVHDSFTVSIKPSLPVAAAQLQKIAVQLTNNKSKEATKGTLNNGWYDAKFRDLGDFQLLIDETPPVITPIGFADGGNVKGKPSLTILVTDNLTQLTSFSAELDGNWLMFKRKKDYFIYDFDDFFAPGTHYLVITATDALGNRAEKRYTLTR